MTIVGLISSLEGSSKILFKWFDDNHIKANSDKSHLLLSTKSDVDITANVNEDITSNTKSEKLLGVTIDPKLTFDEHFSRICDKASFGKYFLFMKPVQQR